MEKHFERVHEKLDKLTEDMTDMKVVQAQQHEILKEHMRRTLANEEAIKLQREYVDLLRDEVKQELKPVKNHVYLINNIFKFIIAFSSVLIFLNQMGWLNKLISFLF